MRVLKTVVAILTAICICVSLSGCSFRIKSFDNLIHPPKLSGKYQGLQDAFESKVGNGFDLKTPENGDYQSAFITYDIDSDGDEEALVFYSKDGQADTVRFYFFEYADGDWTAVSSYDGLGNSVDQVIFDDINKDGKSEIIIGWGLFSSKTNKVFGVYDASDVGMTMLNSFPYTYIDIIDVNGDGIDDIFTLALDSTIPEQVSAYARAYNFSDTGNSIAVLSEVRTDGNISSYSSVAVEKTDENNLIYIEANKGEHEMITEVVYWNDEKNALVAPLFDVSSQTTKLTWRNNKVVSADIDSDKYLEIPTSVEMQGSAVTDTKSSKNVVSNSSVSESLNYIKWTKFRDDKLKSVQYSIINDYCGYMLNIPSSWVGRITVIGSDGHWDFYRWNSSQQKVGELLFSIGMYNKSDAESKKKYQSYHELSTVGTNTFAYTVTDDGYSFGVKDKTIETNFVTSNYGGIS